LTARLR